MKKNKQKFLGKIKSILDFPTDAYMGGFRIEMYSENEAIVWGASGISDFTAEKIELFYKRGIIVFEGERLLCESYVDGVVIIQGYIVSVRLEKRKK